MKRTKRAAKAALTADTTRASISFPSVLYTALEELAKKKKVSLAWVVRDAVEKYVSDEKTEATGGGRQA